MTTDREKLMMQLDTGEYLSDIRTKKGLKLTAVAKDLGISHPYLSEIEKGFRLPSDELIRNIADYYKIDENELFIKYGKIPLLAREEFKDMTELHDVLSGLKRSNISDDQRHRLSDAIVKLYKEFLEEINSNEDDNT